jgi:hypothetical protein
MYCDTQKNTRGKILIKNLEFEKVFTFVNFEMHACVSNYETYLQIRPFIKKLLITFSYLMVPCLFKQVGAHLTQP